MKIEDKNINLLVIEDSDEDFESFIRVLKNLDFYKPIYRCSDGDTALDFLLQAGDYAKPETAPRPNLILLDLNLPGTDGREVLETLKKNEELKLIPVVVFTTSFNQKDVQFCYEQGVNNYILKPMGLSALTETINILIRYWFEFSVLPE
ncbi:response regulator [Sphaerospermopsis aphanizomenoides BCCUSP55]|uniref:response regulator n=1 Tax=Sphaerospermopsis aphanizomenoides TaxID=459663 RepID=UPI000A5B9B78|nr:response regulator [Sphaerospermopsis aphanizomenoides]MBK1988527.1 response regulator [Sphaerospermopsis aphanizomenoides BCCUSP55]